jgi:hypothetical protein
MIDAARVEIFKVSSGLKENCFGYTANVIST